MTTRLSVRRSAAWFTSEADFDVCGEAENGQDAIEKAQVLHPDLIVMDLSMPVMNGIDAARTLKTLMPTVPVIIFSDYSNVFSEKEARSAGISALVSKSQQVSVLIDRARTLLFHLPPDPHFFSQSGNPRPSLLRTRSAARASSAFSEGLPTTREIE
jgi:DNA-binding NarL/FixJ family response regulator